MSFAYVSKGPVQKGFDSAQTRLVVLPQLRHWLQWPAVMGAVVLALGFGMKSLPGLTSAEFAIDQNMSTHHTGAVNAVALTLDALFGDLSGAILLIVACLYLLVIRHAPVNAIAFGAVTAVGWLSCYIVKAVVGRPRPDQTLLADPLVTVPATHSFPSGQVCLATALAFALYYLARRTTWQRPTLGFGIILVLVVALSRLYLGVHYPTDVVASIATASGAILFFSGLWNRHAVAIISRMGFLAPFGPLPSRTDKTRNHK